VYVIKSVVLKGVPSIDNVIPCNKDWLWLIGPVEYVEQGIFMGWVYHCRLSFSKNPKL